MNRTRPTRETLHMKTAELWAQRSTCKRPQRLVGCVITTTDLKRILAIGYNGPPFGLSNDSCRDVTGDCGCIHAEANAVAAVDSTILGKVIFTTLEPCENCAGLITQANIRKVYYINEYRDHKGLERLKACGIEVEQLKPDNYQG